MNQNSTIMDFFADLFEFLIEQLTNIAGFFTSSDLGRFILGIGFFYILVNVVLTIVNKIKK